MYKNLLVPVVLDEEHDGKASLHAAKTLADKGAQFTLLHVIEAIPAFVASQIPDDILANSRNDAAEGLNKMAASLPGSKTALLTGHAGSAIVDYAETNGIDCIVMASHKPGLENLFLGSTADRVVRHAKCSVHVIR